MRSVTKAAVVAALALAGCGNYSTEDLRFLAALPSREDLQVAVPATAEAAAVAAAKGALGLQAPGDVCALGNAELWGWAKPTSDDLNGFVDFIVGLVDVVRRHPPTWREEETRGWGPFDDENHPGREILIGIARTYPDELAGGAPRHLFAFQARVKGTSDFTTIVFGAFDGGSAARGKGWILLDFEALHRLGMNDAATPHGTLQVAYDRSTDPVTIQLVRDPDASGPEIFFYRFAGYAAGGGVFDYAIRDPGSNLLLIGTRYDAAGAGRAGVVFTPAGSMVSGWFEQCWDASACLVYVEDSGNHSCDETQWPGSTCTRGDVAACADVPESPFPP
jgi:hypothetical protein